MKKLKAKPGATKATAFAGIDRAAILPMPSDSDLAKDMLLWARKQRIVVSRVQVGVVVLDVLDLALPEDAAKQTTPPERRKSLIEEYGGSMLEQATSGIETVEPTEEDDD